MSVETTHMQLQFHPFCEHNFLACMAPLKKVLSLCQIDTFPVPLSWSTLVPMQLSETFLTTLFLFRFF